MRQFMVCRPARVFIGRGSSHFLTDPPSQRPSSPSRRGHAASHPGRPNEGVGIGATGCILTASYAVNALLATLPPLIYKLQAGQLGYTEEITLLTSFFMLVLSQGSQLGVNFVPLRWGLRHPHTWTSHREGKSRRIEL